MAKTRWKKKCWKQTNNQKNPKTNKQLDGFCKSVCKLDLFDWNEAVTGYTSAHSWHSPMHACWRLSQDGSSTWFPLLCPLLSATPFPLLPPSISCTTEPPTTPSSSFICLLFFSSGGDRANKQTNKLQILCMYVWMYFPGCKQLVFHSFTHFLCEPLTHVTCLFLNHVWWQPVSPPNTLMPFSNLEGPGSSVIQPAMLFQLSSAVFILDFVPGEY